jgi:hypothetical protein
MKVNTYSYLIFPRNVIARRIVPKQSPHNTVNIASLSKALLAMT